MSIGRSIWLTVLVSCSLFLLSCVADQADRVPTDKRLATIRLNLAATRSEEGDPADSNISSLRMLVYDSESGDLELNTPFEQIPTGGKSVTLEVPVGIHDFVFIANEDSDSSLKEQLTSVANAAIYNINKLNDISFERSAFDADNDIPMAMLIEGVEVTSDDTVVVPGMDAPVTDVWMVDVERIAIRLGITITMPKGQFGKWVEPQSISLSGIPDRAYLLPAIDNSVNRISGDEIFVASGEPGEAPGFISETDADGNVATTFDRLILPELYLSAPNDIEGNALTVSMDFGDNIKTGRIRALEEYGFGFGLPRNIFLDLKVDVKQDFLEVTGAILPWEEVPLDDKTLSSQYTLTVERSEYFFNSHGGTLPAGIATDHPKGWKIENNTIAWDHTLPTLGNNNLTVSEYTVGTTPRTGTFTVRAGNIAKTIRVTQFPPVATLTDVIIPFSYIGAFWKAGQTGERLINIASVPDTGDWVAIVAEGEDWIHLDTEMTRDSNVGLWGADESLVANGNDPGFDNTYFVGGNLKYVSGTVDSDNPRIYFRIGLNSTHTPTDATPARYGVVLLSYAGNTKMQRIWIRQGEDADFLMRQTDPSPGYSGYPPRPAAARFSPYNLTAPGMPGTTLQSVTLPVKGGVFTDYPTQAGSFFEWAPSKDGTEPINAYTPIPGLSIESKPIFSAGVFWNTLGPYNETCPEGYRRPADGLIDAYSRNMTTMELEKSEIRQSLVSSPMTIDETYDIFISSDNGVYGYYADGFFDRRKFNTTLSDYPAADALNTVVSWGTNDIAYAGRLIFNPATNASLFFPLTGAYNEGEKSNDSGYGEYMSASLSNNAEGVIGMKTVAFLTSAVLYTYIFMDAISIRCVAD